METPDPPKKTPLKPLKTGSNLTLSYTAKKKQEIHKRYPKNNLKLQCTPG